MIYNISYRDREIIKEINDTLGKPFGLIERFKMKGIGSPRFILNSASEEITTRLPSDESLVKVSIELRPSGIIVHFKKFTEHYSWIIPYYKLTIYQSSLLSIYSEEIFMKFITKSLKKPHRKFLTKLIGLKAEYSKNQIY
tara:strand:+ start:2321 stop:2740 length:420 start_codon:yes stop_codon:yes gene_type:complete